MGFSLHMRLLGDFALLYNNVPVASVNTPRMQSLLAYLVLHRDAPQLRHHLAYLFWPDSSEAQARTNLRREFHHLRHALPDADRFLSADAQTLQWNPSAPFTLDVATFEGALAAADRAAEAGVTAVVVEQLEAAISVYHSDLLPGCYDEWLLPARERLRQQHLQALERLIQLLEEQRNYAAAIRYAQRLLQHDPLYEATYRCLMRLHALNNDRARALRVYHACVTMLQQELGVEPESLTRDLYQRILSTTNPPATAPLAPVPASRVPLIGRRREWQQLQSAWRLATDGRAHLVVVQGQAGIGKSRLAEELLHWAGQQGIATARTRSYEAEGRLAYAPVVEWLRSDALRAARSRLSPVWLTEIARLLPELLAEHTDLQRPEPLTESWQRQRLFEALARAILAAEQPLLLQIDDLQWCDQDTLEWLHYLLRFDPTARVLIVGTARAEELMPAHSLQTLLMNLHQREQATEITLGPLDSHETATLAAHVAGRELDSSRTAQLFQDTEGNPLFIVETVRAELGSPEAQEATRGDSPVLQSSTHHAAIPLPPRVHAVIKARLAQLSPPARELARLAAAIGREFAFDVLARASDGDEDRVVRALDELWQRYIVRQQEREAYDFSHDKIREVAYAELSKAQRRLFHRRIAEALQAVDPDLDRVSAQVAAHYEQADLPAQAIPYYQRAATVAQGIYANADAIDLLNRALALLARLPESRARDEQELALQTTLGFCLVALKGYPASEGRAAFDRAQVLYRRLGQPPSPPVLRATAIAFVGGGEVQQAHTLGEQLLAIARNSDDPILLTEAHYVLGVSLFWLGEFVPARTHLEQAVAHYDRRRHRLHTSLYGQDPGVVCLSRLALDLWYLGYPVQAAQRSQEALQLARELSHPLSQAYTMNYVAWIANECQDIEQTRELAETMQTLSDKYQLGFWPPTVMILKGWVLAAQGQLQAGVARMRQGIADSQSTRQRLHLPYLLTLLARTYGQAGQIGQGLSILDEASALVEQTGERFYAAEICRLTGELRRMQGADEFEVEGCFRQALDIAHRQHARSLELRAAMSMSRLWQGQGKTTAARELLAELYGWFTEGFDTPDLQEARALLNALHR